jgi:ClpP class serine protease
MSPFDLACAIPWCITEEGLAAVLSVANLPRDERSLERWELIASKLGKPIEHASRSVTVDESTGIASIPIDGPIFRKANMMTRVSGATSTDLLMRDFRAAIESPDVSAVVLAIDSPGGDAWGTHDMAELVHAARGRKPVVAHAWGQCCSGAYWIASAADRIVASPMARVGSIGAIGTIRDTEDPKGTYNFVSSVSPLKHTNLKSGATLARLQEEIDELGQTFVGAVARYRGVPESKVLADYGQGASFVGNHAHRRGMVDSLGTYADIERSLAGKVARPAPSPVPDPFQEFINGIA